jgi:PAS domain S-box-containing protein
VPFASIVLTGCGEAWCNTNEPLAAAAVPRHDPFSEYTSLAPGLFEVPDANLDERFRDTECVTGMLAVRSYAGCALRTARGDVLGTLAVYGTTARPLAPDQRASLILLAEQGVAHAELRAHLAELEILSGAQPAIPPPVSDQVVATDGVPGFVGTITDFTDLVNARDHLRKAETMFRTTFDQAPIGIAHADRRGRLLRYNQAFCTMLGFGPGELSNKTLGELTHGDDVARVSAELKRLWNGEVQCVDLEKRHIRKDGSAHWVRITTALVRDGDGKPQYSVEFLRDISARKESAEELEQVHKQLLVASRQAGMAEVATNVLHNVGNVLNSVNVSVSLIAEGIKKSKCAGLGRAAALLSEHAHDLATFLAGAQGKHLPPYLQELAADLVRERDTATAELSALRNNVEHIKEIVAMQQSYARRGGVIDTLDIRVLVEDSLRMNEGAFSRHGVVLSRDFEDVPPVQVDKHQVLLILVNVIRNAKYACDEAKDGEKRVTVRVRAANDSVLISVIDTGVGIPKENLNRIFNHGFTTRPDGHGFGLHSSALAAKALGGSLHAESAGPGQGATFTLTLPFASPESLDAK